MTQLQLTELISSPRTRRYFLRTAGMGYEQILFSAHAEVFPLRSWGLITVIALLRARGGISVLTGVWNGIKDSSPRTRRYFLMRLRAVMLSWLFSAHAEVFR